MKRVIKDVLPTFGSGTKDRLSQLDSPVFFLHLGFVMGQVLLPLCSPRKTSLYFSVSLLLEENS